MDIKELRWDNIHNLDDNQITYLLYLEGKSIDAISLIRNISRLEVEKQIIKGKITIEKKSVTITKDLLINIISMGKDERIDYIKNLDISSKDFLVKDILKRYIKFKNHEDRMIIIWTIGELEDKRLLPILRMELKSKNANIRRLSCSALGKIRENTSKEWLEPMIFDKSPQVRQYAIKALSHVGDNNTLEEIKKVLINNLEKDYVKRAALAAIDKLRA